MKVNFWLLLVCTFLSYTLRTSVNATISLNTLCAEKTDESTSGRGDRVNSKDAPWSCQRMKLRILVVDYGFVDSMTGAANRHLGILTTLGALGHTVKRAALRVGKTKRLPPLAEGVFESMSIEQHSKRLLNFKTGSLDEYVSLVRSWDPDLVVMVLWFCGPTLNITTPGQLLSRHRTEHFRARVVIESSDVHSLREEHLGYMNKRPAEEADKHLALMQVCCESTIHDPPHAYAFACFNPQPNTFYH